MQSATQGLVRVGGRWTTRDPHNINTVPRRVRVEQVEGEAARVVDEVTGEAWVERTSIIERFWTRRPSSGVFRRVAS